MTLEPGGRGPGPRELLEPRSCCSAPHEVLMIASACAALLERPASKVRTSSTYTGR